MNIFIERQKKPVQYQEDLIVSALLKRLGLRASEVLVVRNKQLVTEDALLKKEDDITILSVISGG